MAKKKNKRPWGVFLSIFLGILLGSLVGDKASLFGVSLYAVVDTAGSLFINALTLVVVPLVSASIIVGMSRIGEDAGFKRLGAKMFSFYMGTSLIAILIGLFFVNIFAPGEGLTPPTDFSASRSVSAIQEQVSANGSSQWVSLLFSIVPSNIIRALAKGDMLALIFFSLIFGFCISRIDEKPAASLKGFFLGLFQTMIQFTHVIMKVLPYGVFCLVAKVFMTTGIKSLASVAFFFITVLLSLTTFMFIALPLLLKLIAKVKPLRHFKAMTPALITAFSTSSSSAALPITIDCVEKRAKVSNRVCSLVVPLGTSVNMSGSALYECVAAMFVAQVYGIDLSFTTQFLVVLLSLITSMGVAGIPSASLVAVLVILKSIGLPSEGIGLFIAVDRVLDMCRTTVNVFSDSCCAVLIAKTEGENQVLSSDVFEEA